MFSSLRLRAKLLLLALLPVLLLTLLISGISVFLLQGLAHQQEDQARDSLIAARKSGLQQLVVQGRSQIEDIYQASAPGDTAARDRALAVLGRLSYEPESYFWGYDENCIRTLHGADGEGVGKDYSKAKDPNGVYSCIEQVKAGKNGTHYVYYTFKLGTSDKVVPKIGYAEWLDKWKMVIGTSLNLDDIELAVQAEQERFQSSIRKLLGVMIGSAFALFIVVAVLATLFSGTILRPLLRIQANLDDMASGDGNLTHRLPVDSTDELGDVATAFNSFMEKIHGMVKQVAGTTTHLSSLVGAVSEQAQRSEEATEGQRKETVQVATAIHEMTAAAQEVAASAQRASEAARQTDQEGAAAKQVVEGSVARIHRLVDEIRSGNLAIDSLREDVKGIVGVLEVIRGIANQTNLLALNAAIEAARAGESGRGFAVVADEVRALASRTRQSTGEIQTMIDRLQAATQQAVQAMHRASEMGTDTTMQANLAGQSLDEIARLIATINTMNAQIAGAAGDQTTAVEEISQSVHEIATSVDGVAADAAQGAHTARELHGIGGELQALVGQFKI